MTDLKDQLRVLGLRHTAETLDDLVALATKSRWGAHQLFEHVARTEAEDRARRSLERRLGRSKLGAFKLTSLAGASGGRGRPEAGWTRMVPCSGIQGRHP